MTEVINVPRGKRFVTDEEAERLKARMAKALEEMGEKSLLHEQQEILPEAEKR